MQSQTLTPQSHCPSAVEPRIRDQSSAQPEPSNIHRAPSHLRNAI